MQLPGNNWARGAVYGQPLRSRRPKKSMETNQTTNQSLPQINPNQTYKANAVRSQLSATKSHIMLMEAKINTLRIVKQKIQTRNKSHSNKIQFLRNIKERVLKDQLQKKRIKEQRHQSQQILKAQVQELRQSLVRQRQHAQTTLRQQKLGQAQQQRQRKKHHQYLIQKLKELDHMEGSRKVQKVKEQHVEAQYKIKDFQHSRINFSRQNYQQKLMTTLKQKQSAHMKLLRLKQQQNKLIQQVQKSQNIMLKSLSQLQSMNPELVTHRKQSKVKTNTKAQNPYQNDLFQI